MSPLNLHTPPKIVVFSRGKPEWTHTGRILHASNAQRDVIWVVSDDDDVTMYKKSTGSKVIVAKGTSTLAEKRRWAIEELTSKRNPWIIWLEDNITRITAVAHEHYHRERIDKTTRMMYHERHLGFHELIGLILKDIELAEKFGATYGGFANNDNHYFRKTKYRKVSFVWTKMCYFSRRGPEWQVGVREKDDYLNTAHQLLHAGIVLTNNFIYPWPKKFEGRGSSRKKEDRFEDKQEAVKIITERYPGLFRIRDKAGCPTGTEIQLRSTNRKTLDEWRSQYDTRFL